jgi:branched-chain amino acid transport system permease protein
VNKPKKTRNWLAFLILVFLFMTGIHFFTADYFSIFLYQLLIYMVLAVSYDILGGYAGYMNLGHSCFFGIGAYGFAILAKQKLGLVLSLTGGIVAAVLFAILISYPFFRLRGAYFALATLGLFILLNLLVNNLKGLTGGPDGLFIPIPYNLTIVFYLSLIVCVATIYLSYRIGKSKFGLALVSIRADEDVANSFGVSTYRSKLAALILGAIPASLVGGILAWALTYIHPDSIFGVEMALVPVTMALLGGTGYVVGAVVGSLFITVIQEIIWTRIPYLHVAIYGVILILIGLYMPGGLTRTNIFSSLLKRINLTERIFCQSS